MDTHLACIRQIKGTAYLSKEAAELVFADAAAKFRANLWDVGKR